MNAPAPLYRKVPGGGLSLAGFGGLWLADDHLLEIGSYVVLERYRRFFYHDVRAVVVEQTKVRLAWSWVFATVGGLFAIIASALWISARLDSAQDLQILLYILAVPCGLIALLLLVLLVINLARGPSCRCHLLTSTGWHVLAAPRRLSRAGEAQGRISAAVQAIQSPASPAAAVTS
jgi:hypothetical protein